MNGFAFKYGRTRYSRGVTRAIPIRCSPPLITGIAQLAAEADMPWSTYARDVLQHHVIAKARQGVASNDR
jgi:predicted DNA binding CopG/RHH family protein